MSDAQYLYLTTRGRRTGNPHQIEIWFVEHERNYYIMSEARERSDWVQNILHDPAIRVRVGSRDADEWHGMGRVIDPAQEPELAGAVQRKMDSKYSWDSGLIVELKPNDA